MQDIYCNEEMSQEIAKWQQMALFQPALFSCSQAVAMQQKLAESTRMKTVDSLFTFPAHAHSVFSRPTVFDCPEC